ncbi:MAG: ABC transporter permease [Bacteroidia bacterium]|nr:ABC transporter permease [Bacteroidia bacterium]
MLFRLAWRNLWRNKRRTLITVSAVIFATWLSIAMRGLQLGTYEQNITFSLNLFSGHVQLQHPDFPDNPTLHNTFVFDERTSSLLRRDARVRAFAPRIIADGLLSYRDNSQGAAIFGVDPAAEARVSRILRRIHDGRGLANAEAREVVVGLTMLQNLRAAVGDDIVILAQGRDGSLGNMKYRIVGTVQTGMPDFDRSAVFMGIEALRELVSMPRHTSVVAVALHDLNDVGPVTDALDATLSGGGIRAFSWQEVMPELKQSIDLDNYSSILFLGILIVVVAFGILNTVLMSVTERFREFGILLAIGMPQRLLVRLVLLETLFIIMTGVLVGNLFAYGVVSWFAAHPIVFTGEYAAMMEEFGWLPQMGSVVRLSSFVNTSFAVVILSLLAAVYPLYRVSRLEALKGIRYT